MIKIKKNKEPNLLTLYKKQKDAYYDGPDFTEVKNKIKDSLLQEQGFICAYCMKRISKDSMKVEHWACQSKHPKKQLQYINLLGCCKGGEGFSPTQQTCDTHKGNADIAYSPVEEIFTLANFITYTSRGKILSSDTSFNTHINDILNLNEPRLILNRKIVLEKIQKNLHDKIGKVKNNEIDKLIYKYKQKNNNNMHIEYLGVVISYLMKKQKNG